jgi:hypothetical protein
MVLRCAHHAQPIGLCLGAFLICATSALGDTFGVDAYNQWQSGGARRTSALPVALPSSGLVSTSSIASTLETATIATLTAPAATSGGTASLSGYVFLDTNPNDGSMNTSDWCIAGAQVELIPDVGNPIFAYTQSSGDYAFNNLAPATYSIKIMTPYGLPGTDAIGQLRNASQQLVSPGQLDAANRTFYNIVVGNGYTGTWYNFADLAYPVTLISKRMFLNDSPPIENVVPEPGTLVLLAMAGLVMCWPLSRRLLGRFS